MDNTHLDEWYKIGQDDAYYQTFFPPRENEVDCSIDDIRDIRAAYIRGWHVARANGAGK